MLFDRWQYGTVKFMASLTLRNVPKRLKERLRQGATQNRRSMSREAIVCLERVLVSRRADPEELLAHRPASREGHRRILVTDRDLRTAKSWGRL